MVLRIDYGFAYEYAYQAHEYIIRIMNTKHPGLVTKLYTYSRLHKRL